MEQDLLTIDGVVKFFINRLEGNYICSDVEENMWHEFRNHSWKNIYIFQKYWEICSEISRLLQNIISDLSLGQFCQDNDTRLYIDTRAQMRMLNNSAYKLLVVRKCAELLYDSDFIKKLDNNINLICFENGVYDLSTNTFRDGKSEDYVSCHIYYRYDQTKQKNSGLNEFFRKIQPDKPMRKYLKKILSNTLSDTKEKKSYIFLGDKSCGTTAILNLLKKTLGDGLHGNIFPTQISLFMETDCLENLVYAEKYHPIFGKIIIVPFTNILPDINDINFKEWLPYMMNKMLKYHKMDDFKYPQQVAEITKEYYTMYTNIRLQKEIKHNIKRECGNIVSQKMYAEELHEILQKKYFVFMNASWFEKYAKRGIYNCGNLKCSLILYYLEQESDFSQWYRKSENVFEGY
ncbi:MAG: putative helicase [Satyrvirus sp.]|uniref:Putative helicase n=1 Tax=Satyrvirus sp. TaxID=2487771 RepID=A0A3G5AE97_9VIRU|nr:MAG: putative helicase [Satyrvirus sp.]